MKNIFLIICVFSFSAFGCSPMENSGDVNVSDVDSILHKMRVAAKDLKTYTAEITSVYLQPLLEASTTRTGRIYYSKDPNGSALAIDFLTRQDDNNPPQSDRQRYIFDGVWLWRINYQTRHTEKRQLAAEDAPEDVLGLVGKNFPLLGFSQIDKLKQDFDITMLESETASTELHLIPKEKTRFIEEYSKLICAIDEKMDLPANITAFTLEEDIYEIKFTSAVIGRPIDPNTFNPDFPSDFTLETIPLKSEK